MTTAVRLPVAVGCVVKATVIDVPVEFTEVAVPKAPLLNATVLLAGVVVEKPVPVIVIVEALIARLVVLVLTVGAATMFATSTDVPLVPPFEVTTAVRLSKAVSGVDKKATVNWVVVAAVTEPKAPLLKVTVLLPGVVSKPFPLIIKLFVALIARAAELRVIVGAGTIVAT